MFVIVPLCEVPSPAKSNRLLDLITDVSVFTRQHEPKCLAYVWFRSAGNISAVPQHWIRGIEVYESPEDNRETHRAGEAYQAFRAAVVAEHLLQGYPDVRFWCPTGVGFSSSAPVDFTNKDNESHGYIVVQDLTPLPTMKPQLLKAFELVAKAAGKCAKVGSFWVLEREKEEDGQELIVFSAFGTKGDYETFVSSKEASSWSSIGDMCQNIITSAWLDSSIGFLGR